ncbi:hypothetical protein TYRP_019549, partial [Tyrophagus putrescentiae]
YVPIDCSVDAAAAPSACTTAHPTYRIGVEANEAVVVAALLCLLPFIATNGRRVEKAQRGNAMDDVASVATVVLLIVVRTGELVWTGGIAQQGENQLFKTVEKLYASQSLQAVEAKVQAANATGKVEGNRRGNMPGVLAHMNPVNSSSGTSSSMRSLTVPVFIRSLSPALLSNAPKSVGGGPRRRPPPYLVWDADMLQFRQWMQNISTSDISPAREVHI